MIGAGLGFEVLNSIFETFLRKIIIYKLTFRTSSTVIEDTTLIGARLGCEVVNPLVETSLTQTSYI